MLDNFLIKNLNSINKACDKYNVERLYVFGSIVDGRFIEGKSDIDMLVEFSDIHTSSDQKPDMLLKLWIRLQSILESKVDLIVNENIDDEHFIKYLNLYKQLVYERIREVND